VIDEPIGEALDHDIAKGEEVETEIDRSLTRPRDGCFAATSVAKSGMMSGRSTRRKA
jgi:hypothetical protein